MKELTVPDQRLLFVHAVQQDGLSVAAACRHFAISRVTGYKILRRFEEHGVPGLDDDLTTTPVRPFTAPTPSVRRGSSAFFHSKPRIPPGDPRNCGPS